MQTLIKNGRSTVTGMDKLTITLPYLPLGVLSPNSRAHWTKRRRESLRIKDYVKALVLEQGWQNPPLAKATVSIDFGLPDNRVRDDDNLAGNGMVKAILDALTGKVRGIDANGKPNGPWLPDRFVLQEDDRAHTRVVFDTHESPGRPETVVTVEAADGS